MKVVRHQKERVELDSSLVFAEHSAHQTSEGQRQNNAQHHNGSAVPTGANRQ